jgi:hypothetical protein
VSKKEAEAKAANHAVMKQWREGADQGVADAEYTSVKGPECKFVGQALLTKASAHRDGAPSRYNFATNRVIFIRMCIKRSHKKWALIIFFGDIQKEFWAGACGNSFQLQQRLQLLKTQLPTRNMAFAIRDILV